MIATQQAHHRQGGASPAAGKAAGVALVLLGLAYNHWAIGALFAPDGHIFSPKKIGGIFATQAVVVAVGLWLLLRGRASGAPRLLRYAGWIGAVVLLALGVAGNALAFGILQPNREFHEAVRNMVDSEDLILALTPDLKLFNEAAKNFGIPDEKSLRLFEDSVTVADLDPAGVPEQTKEAAGVGVVFRAWPVAATPRTSAAADLDLYRRILDKVDFFESAKLYFIKGTLNPPAKDTLDSVMGFSATARLVDGRWASFKGTQAVVWKKHPSSDPKKRDADWKIREFRVQGMKSIEARQILFQDVTEASLADPAVRMAARGSIQDQRVEAAFKDESHPRPKHWTFQSWDRHPGIAAVDIEGDGDDDLYVMDQWGKNLLLRNRGDGTFEEAAAEVGLDLEDHCSSAIFADFDNDGDRDAFIGRTLQRSVYLVNEGGRYVDRSEEMVDRPLPFLASAVTAVDYDLDGLLDVYISTYAAQIVQNEFKNAGWFADRLLAEFLPEEDAVELYRQMTSGQFHIVTSKPGPPNVLLRNTGGGRFVEAREATPLFLFRNTYQATWADIDGDGDPDVYCANDFADNNLFRNDGGGKFTDITAETGTADIGFGMGASFGDYDRDGRQDLYVSNMFSKAGRRITAQVPGLNPIFAQMARGNSLFRNVEAGAWPKVSGEEPPALTVEIADWSYGSQFVDVDNDGYLDIFAPAGYYTAPKAVEIPRDT